VNCRTIETRKRQCCNSQRQRRAPHPHPPTGTIVDHETSGSSGIEHAPPGFTV
jgi:hypothetical protein